jgi:hydrogenase expression/formation protein HypC
MCLALPSLVVAVDGWRAVVEVAGARREVNLMLLGEGAVAPGDYVLVQHGQFAYERLDAQAAHEALALIEGVVTAGNGTDVRSW